MARETVGKKGRVSRGTTTARKAAAAKPKARPPAARPTRASRREETRQRIYAAALAAFRRDGVASARIDDIAREARVSHGAFYVHFPTKEAVLLELLAESERRIVGRLARLPPSAAVSRVLRTMVEAMSEEWEGDAALFATAGLAAMRSSAELSRSVEAHLVRGALIERLKVAPGLARKVRAAPDTVVDVILIALFLASLRWVASREGELVDSLAWAVDVILHGIEE